MSRYGWILSFVFVVATVMIGCEKQDSATPTTPASPAAPPTPPPTPSAADTPAPAIPPVTAPDATPATAAVGAAATQAAVSTAEAQKMLDQALTYIKENKLELAEKTLTQLEGMKASLPEAMQPRIAEARKLLDGAKAAGGVSLPALPGAK